MSGDVQPRKRKDKKRRKDDSIDQPVPPPQPHVAPKENGDDVNIHVHKEAGTGGNICSKIVFFLLFSALTVLIGLIILEHRGLTDLEASDGESRYAHIFEGWIDTSHDDHDDHNIEAAIDEHEEEHDLGDEHDLEEDEHNSEQDEHDLEDDEHGSEEDEHDLEDDDEVDHDEDDEEKEENEENESEENLSEQEEDDDINKYETQEVDDDDDQNEDIDEDEDEDEDDQTNENEVSDEDNALENDDEEEEDNASPEVLSKEVDDFDDDDQKDDDDQDDISKEEDNDDDDVEPVKRDLEENDDNDENEDENEEESNGTSGSSMIVKLGVGVALLVVAHFVLVRKWKSAQEDAPIAVDKEPTPDLSRRNTIIPPPTLQEVEQDIENDDEEYSEDEDYSEEEFRVEPKSAKAKYQELRSTYSRSLTPDIDSEVRRKPKPDEFEYEDEESVEEEEEGEDEEEYDEEDDEEGVEEESESEEDEEVLKRLETKYGNIRKGRPAKKQEQGRLSSWKHVKMPEGNAEESEDSDRQSEDGAGYGTGYEHSAVTNKDDWEIRDKIDEAQGAIKKSAAYAIKLFDAILAKFPSSPRSLYGKALALDILADEKRSNTVLEQAIQQYFKVLNVPKIPDKLFEVAADGCIKRLRFLGQYRKALSVHNALIERYPNNATYYNELTVTYLTINSVDKARLLLKRTLKKWPNNGFALVHFGFILKTVDNNLTGAVKYLQDGIKTNEKGVVDGRFYFHLGDALERLGKHQEAMQIYEEGVKNKLFLSKYQRSLYNVNRLTGRPWWNMEQTPYQKLYNELKSNWKKIAEEGMLILNQKRYFQNETENLRDTGDWKQFELFSRGVKHTENCKKCPVTCKIIENNPMARFCKRGQTKFSVMHPGTHVWPHCGPTNCRLRVHLGLKVPPKTFIRVGDEIRSWENGKILIFDDSFEHEVWHNGTEFRLILIVDVWHPELKEIEKRSLSPI